MTPDDFLARWAGVLGNERANHQLFLNDLCDLLGVAKPQPWSDDRDNGYCCEFRVEDVAIDGTRHRNSLDAYRRGHFILECKAASGRGARRGTPAHALRLRDAAAQAEGYARALAKQNEPPIPFLIVADIGGSLDLYADFSRSRRGWRPFPTPGAQRIPIADLAKPEIRAHLARIWNDPYSLDPAASAQRVTRQAAAQLAGLARALRDPGRDRATIAAFLIRYFFCAFAEDIGLLKPRQFTEFLIRLRPVAENAHRSLEALWRDLNEGGWSTTLGDTVPRINGGMFHECTALPVTAAQLELLIRTAEMRWDEVQPAIFGTVLEHALDADERHRLGAHFTPPAYVELLVEHTILDPLRVEWSRVKDAITALLPADGAPTKGGAATKGAQALLATLTGASPDDARQGRRAAAASAEDHALGLAQRILAAFHRRLAAVRVLDPACGTGNFLYVALDLLKRLEAEVVALERELGGGDERVDDLGIHPRNFLGLEINPDAVPVAELVLWIGWLQWYRRTRPPGITTWPSPVLRDEQQIHRQDALLAYERSEPTSDTRWDGVTTIPSPTTGEPIPDPAARIPVLRYVGVTRADWPAADFIVGNPPFIGNKRLRAALGDGYAEALRATWAEVPETADFVMYWWHHAAALARSGAVRRFGFITTNSITQTQQRAVTTPHLDAGLGLAWAVPDHPWVDTEGGAAVRVAMTVAAAGITSGTLTTVEREEPAPSPDDPPKVTYRHVEGRINPDLSIGADVSAAVALRANEGICFQGMNLVGEGFRLTREQAAAFGPCPVIKPYQKAKVLVQGGDSGLVIDCFGLDAPGLLENHPAIYQYLNEQVKPERDHNNRDSYRLKWWIFGEPRGRMRLALQGIPRYIATAETSKFKPFVFLDASVVPDHKLYAIASADALTLGVLSSRWHQVWANAAGGRMGVGNDPTWTNTTTFLPFPFPTSTPAQADRIRALGEQLDAHRKRQQAAHPGLTLTGMYNVLAKLRSGEPLTAKEQAIHQQGLVVVLRQLHDDLDAAVAAAYGWPVDLPDGDLLARLVALNAERAREEAAGAVRWLRPDLQASKAGMSPPRRDAAPDVATSVPASKADTLAGGRGRRGRERSVETMPLPVVPTSRPWPTSLPDRLTALRDMLRTTPEGMTVPQLRECFTGARPADLKTLLTTLAALGHAQWDGSRWMIVN